jgi:putative tryptophan/tyrosine transport system substrate-binding protein
MMSIFPGHSMRRREFISLVGAAAATLPAVARAQKAVKRIYRVGILWANTPAVSRHRFAAFRQSLGELGYVEGENIVFEQRGPDAKSGELARLVAELVAEKVDVILTAGTSPTRAAKSAAGSIPIVMTFVSDPIGSGFVKSLAHPGGNITGLTNFGPEVSVKWLELIGDFSPGTHRIAVLYDSSARALVQAMELAAPKVNARLTTFDLTDDNALPEAFSLFQREHVQALIVTLPPRTADQLMSLVQFATRNRLLAVYWWREYVDAGGLAYYGPSVIDMYQRAAVYVGKILEGTRPADLPVEQPTRFSLVINLSTAKSFGLSVPPALFARADEVIE